MDPNRFKPGWPCSIPGPHHHHHHCRHHHHHQPFLCPHNQLHHHHHHHHCHRHVRPNFAPFPVNPEPASFPAFVPQNLNEAASSGIGEPSCNSAAAAQVAQEQYYGMEDEREEEDEEEPVFVLTDEWRDFFAKSEAKRKLEKKRAKKGKK